MFTVETLDQHERFRLKAVCSELTQSFKLRPEEKPILQELVCTMVLQYQESCQCPLLRLIGKLALQSLEMTVSLTLLREILQTVQAQEISLTKYRQFMEEFDSLMGVEQTGLRFITPQKEQLICSPKSVRGPSIKLIDELANWRHNSDELNDEGNGSVDEVNETEPPQDFNDKSTDDCESRRRMTSSPKRVKQFKLELPQDKHQSELELINTFRRKKGGLFELTLSELLIQEANCDRDERVMAELQIKQRKEIQRNHKGGMRNYLLMSKLKARKK